MCVYTRRWPQKLLHIWQDCESHTVPGSGQVHRAVPSPGVRRICTDRTPAIQRVLCYSERRLDLKMFFVCLNKQVKSLRFRYVPCFSPASDVPSEPDFQHLHKKLGWSSSSQSACQIQWPKNNVLTITRADQSISLGWGCTTSISRE